MVAKKKDSEDLRGTPRPTRFTKAEVEEIEKYGKLIGLDFSNFIRVAAKEKIARIKKQK